MEHTVNNPSRDLHKSFPNCITQPVVIDKGSCKFDDRVSIQNFQKHQTFLLDLGPNKTIFEFLEFLLRRHKNPFGALERQFARVPDIS
jgi:hypothetical protein